MRLCLAAALCILCSSAMAQQNPSNAEMAFIYELNRARHNPQQYDAENNLGGILSGVAAMPPLALNGNLVQSARFHTDEMATHGYFAHVSPITGAHPNKLARDAGYPLPASWSNNANFIESLACVFGSGSSINYPPNNALRTLIIDQGYDPPMHRIQLLGMDSFFGAHREIGTGYSTGLAPVNGFSSGAYWAVHTARRDGGDPLWLTGVVYNDANSNGRYDQGEGVGGVTVTAGAFTAISNSAGGFSLAVPAGSYTVSAAGGSFAGPASAQVNVSGSNVHLEFKSGVALGIVNFTPSSANVPPQISVSSNAGAITNGAAINVGHGTSLAALGLQIAVSDANSDPCSLAATISNQTSQGFVLSEWSSSSAAVPFNRTPSSGTFNVASVSHLVTLTANDGSAQTVFTFTLVVSAANQPPTIVRPSGSSFSGNAGSGFTLNVNPAALPAQAQLALHDPDGDLIDVLSVQVAPATPVGIAAPTASSGNASGTLLVFGGSAASTAPGSYVWTISINDGHHPSVTVQVAITVVDVPPQHSAGPSAASGNGSLGNPYTASVSAGGSPLLQLAAVFDQNASQTLSQVSSVPGSGNASAALVAYFVPGGNSGMVEIAATSTLSSADVGAHDFIVTVTDGTNSVNIGLRVHVTGGSNVPPVAGLVPGSAFSGTMTTGFALTAAAGQALPSAGLAVSDADGDAIEIVSVDIAQALPGVTAPSPQSPSAGPLLLSWTGTPQAGTQGAFTYTLSITDGISAPVAFTVTLNVEDSQIAHAAGPDAMGGDGTAQSPYLARAWRGEWPTLAMAELMPVDRSVAFVLSSVEAHAGNPTGGAGFTIMLAGNTLHVVANEPLRDTDLGAHRFTATVSDGVLSREIALHISVGEREAAEATSKGCQLTPSPNFGMLALLALPVSALLLRRRLARRYRH